MKPDDDLSNGYEAVAADFIRLRSRAGSSIIKRWTNALPQGAKILDIGAGHGVPVTSMLAEMGFLVFAIEPSSTLAAQLSKNCPSVELSIAGFRDSPLLAQHFDGILAIGIVFLLRDAEQVDLLSRVSQALNPDGRFLFSAPWQAVEWADILTGRQSLSLGRDAYHAIMDDVGLKPLAHYEDGAGNHYYEAIRPTSSDA